MTMRSMSSTCARPRSGIDGRGKLLVVRAIERAHLRPGLPGGRFHHVAGGTRPQHAQGQRQPIRGMPASIGREVEVADGHAVVRSIDPRQIARRNEILALDAQSSPPSQVHLAGDGLDKLRLG